MTVKAQDLADVVYASGAVFNGLTTNRLDTRNFLATGSTRGVTSKADLALLQDLKDVAEFVATHTDTPVDARYIMRLNSLVSRSGAIEPGKLRVAADCIGVDTRYGRYEPGPLTAGGLQNLIDRSLSQDGTPIDRAITLFVNVAAAQPFMDGNKRTALFAAEGYVLHAGSRILVSLPTRDTIGGPEATDRFNDLLARAYVFGETRPIEEFLHRFTITIPDDGSPSEDDSPSLIWLSGSHDVLSGGEDPSLTL